MKISSEIENGLQILGLNNYESKAYITLNKMISGTAREIGIAAEVPRPRIYNILKSLQKKGFVEVTTGKPLKFEVVPPKEVIMKHQNVMNQTLDQAAEDLNIIYESQIPNFPAPIWVINGGDKIVKKEIEIISRAENNLMLMCGFLFGEELPQLKEAMENAIERGIKIRMTARSPLKIENSTVNIQEELKDLDIEINISPMPYIKMVARDRKEMLVSFSRHEEENLIPESAVAIWNHYEEFVQILSGVFEPVWRFGAPSTLKRKQL